MWCKTSMIVKIRSCIFVHLKAWVSSSLTGQLASFGEPHSGGTLPRQKLQRQWHCAWHWCLWWQHRRIPRESARVPGCARHLLGQSSGSHFAHCSLVLYLNPLFSFSECCLLPHTTWNTLEGHLGFCHVIRVPALMFSGWVCISCAFAWLGLIIHHLRRAAFT